MILELGKRYVVTRKSKDGTFCVGDHVSINEDGSINCREAQGWIDVADVPEATVGMEVEIDREWIEKRKAEIRAELDKLGG